MASLQLRKLLKVEFEFNLFYLVLFTLVLFLVKVTFLITMYR